ncbi:alanine racemase [Erythrobacter arachoides]|uniref:alanine racemase n=1 Tax=Aurantiacibacter arachoides TaxID=1850444 RepID=A0A845A0W2_9SPHN|nr:alanine racemase [Aurantiacibacter arachoides]MXO93190.1 alanine racemase [Aurantiacibacter arachoides]GGD51321.1 alanine racemase [Aurantiacibacter arachoides]
MTRPEPPPASLQMRIDRDALMANWRALDRLSGTATAGAAVKANAYGLGVDRVAPALLRAGAREFFLAHWSEVAPLLGHVDPAMVSVLHGPRNAAEAAYARATGATPIINSLRQARLWNETGGGRCHLMIDSGINRLGIAPTEANDPEIAHLDIDILLSHLASADEDSALNARQLSVFRQVSQQVKARRRSFGNSAGIMLGADYHFDLTRPGIALYGGVPVSSLGAHVAQVAFPEAAVLQVRALQPGDSVGYNAQWTARRATRAATVSIGYADGFLRARGIGGALGFGDTALPIIGRVSMDMVVVDCGDAPVCEGDYLSIPFDLPAASALSGLSQYEILTTIGHRFQPV